MAYHGKMDPSITMKGYTIELSKLPTHLLKNIRNELYVKPLENPNFESSVKPFPIFRMSKNNIYLPRYYGMTEFGLSATRKIHPGEEVDLSFSGSLRDIQQETIDKTLETYEKYFGGLVSLDTGLGKTVVALKLITMVKLKTLIIVHADFLLEQWVARIKEFIPGARIGVLKQNKCEYLDKDIVVGMIQSIIKRDYPTECFKSFGHLIIDEVHHIGSKTFSSIFFKVQCKYMLGLSATPDRKDGLTKVIYYFLGPQIVNIKRETNNPEISLVYTTNTSDYSEKLTKVGKLNIPAMVTDLTKVSARNTQILELVKEFLKEDRKILVLSDRRSHCEHLNALFIHEGMKSGLYLGGMKVNSREETVNGDIIVGTYQASGEGFDVPCLDTLILATPKSDVVQAVGRVLRQVNKNTPLVVDLVDKWSVFKNQFYKRQKYYKGNGYTIRPG